MGESKHHTTPGSMAKKEAVIEDKNISRGFLGEVEKCTIGQDSNASRTDEISGLLTIWKLH